MMSIHPEAELLSPFIDGALDAPDSSRLEAHLATCRDCSVLLKALRATVDDVRAVPPVEMPPQVGWATRAAVARARSRGGRIGKIIVATTSAAALIAGIGVTVLKPNRTPIIHGPATTAGQDLATGGAAEASTPVVISDVNYTASTVRMLFDLDAAKRTADKAVPGAQSAPSAYNATPAGGYDFSRCERKIRAGAEASARAVLYLVAKYNGAQAYFMLFDSPADDPRTRELWVMRPSDCEVLKFEQKRLR